MNKSNKPNAIPDDNFYKLASETMAAHLLPHVLAIGAKEGKKEIERLPSNWLGSLKEKYTPEDLEVWLSKNEGVDFLQPPNE